MLLGTDYGSLALALMTVRWYCSSGAVFGEDLLPENVPHLDLSDSGSSEILLCLDVRYAGMGDVA